MFDFIRTHQRLMQLVLLVLILPSFVLIGVSGYTTYTSGDEALVKLADSSITTQEFDFARRSQLDQLQRQFGGAFDPAVLDTESARRDLLESLIDRRVVADVATQHRFSVSDAALRQAIAAMPEFQVDGVFSPQRYNELLAMSGMTSKGFEQGQRAELALDRVLSAVTATASVPEPVVELLRKTLAAERTVRLVSFPASDYRAGIAPSDEDIRAWYDQHKDEFALPESVDAQYLVLDEAAAMKNLPAVSEQALQDYYQQNKARYVQPARVNLSHILVQVPAGASAEVRAQSRATAQAIADIVSSAPNTFAQVAREQSQDAGTARNGGSLGWITKGMWPQDIEQAVFALQKGAVSGVVEGPEGLHVFRADDIQPEQGETFEQARAKVEDEVRRQLGAERFADMAGKLTGLVYDNPESLEPAASALGLELRTASGIARDRLLSEDDVGAQAAQASQDARVLEDVRVRRALFAPASLNEKQNSGVIEISPDTIVVVRVAALRPAHVPELAALTPRIRERLVQERATQAAQKAGEAALAAYQAGQGAETPQTLTEPLTLSRIQSQGLSKPVFDAIFRAPADKLPAYVGVADADGYVVARVESASEGSAQAQALLAGMPAELAGAWSGLEQQAVLRSLRTQAKVKIQPLADEALKPETEGA